MSSNNKNRVIWAKVTPFNPFGQFRVHVNVVIFQANEQIYRYK